MKAVIRSWGNRQVMVIGTMSSDLPPGDYALEIDLDLTKARRFVPVPEGMIPAGMDADAILTSGIDLSADAIKYYQSKTGSLNGGQTIALAWTEVPVSYGRRFVNDLVHGFVQVVERPDGTFRVGRGMIQHTLPSQFTVDSVFSLDEDDILAFSEVTRPEFHLAEHTAHVEMGYAYFYEDKTDDEG